MRTTSVRLPHLVPILLAFAAAPALAQTTGTILGVVTDASSGGPVAGALVVATSPSLQGEQNAVTDATGTYRFSLLPPGEYRVAAQLEGYQPAERGELRLSIDKSLRVNLVMVPETVSVEEQVVKTGVAPVIDTQSAETGMVVKQELITNLPVGRTFDSTALLAPGTQADRYGISFNGATSPENGFLVDGLNVSDPVFGTIGIVGPLGVAPATALLTNFVDQIDVKTGSYLPEYGRATGGVLNVVTKSGSNELHGSIFGNLTPYALSPRAKAVTRNARSLANEIVQSQSYQSDFGFELGGPILKDRLWFHLGFAPIFYQTTYDRFVTALTEDPANPGEPLTDPVTGLTVGTRLPGTDKRKVATQRDYQMVGKLTYQLDEDQTLTASTFFEPTSQRRWLDVGTAQGPDPTGGYEGTDSATRQDQSGHLLDLIGRYSGKFLDKHLILEAQLGLHQQAFDSHPGTVDGISQADAATVFWYQTHPLGGFEPVPAACNPTATGFDPCPIDSYLTGGMGFIDHALINRFSAKASATGLFEAAGHHQLKAGFDFEQTRFRHQRAYSGAQTLLELEDGSFYAYRDFSDANDNLLASVTSTSVSNSRALFVQDSWSFLDRFTLNAGVRWEGQDLRGSPGAPPSIDLTNNLAPRVQLVYDFTGQGRGKVAASWGRFYESIPLDIADRTFGSDRQSRYLLDACVGPSPTVGGTPGACPRIASLSPLGGGPAPVAPDLQGQYVDQFGGSVEYEVIPDVSLGLVYTGVRQGAVIEDMSNDEGSFFVANPGISKPFTAGNATYDPRVNRMVDPASGRRIDITYPKAERSYDGITFEVRKIFSKNWLASASYTYSSLRGNYTGQIVPEYGNQLDPNMTAQFDLARLLQNRNGPLPGDRPHQVKLYAARVFPVAAGLNLVAGGTFRAMSGTPISINGYDLDYGPGNSFLLPRGSGGRTPTITSLDLHGGLEYAFTPPYTLRLTVDVFNVLNQQQATDVEQSYTYSYVAPMPNATCKDRNGANAKNPVAGVQADCPDLAYARSTDGRPIVVNKNYGQPTAYQLPLSFRFGLSLSF